MALPAVVLKAKSALGKAQKAYKTYGTAKSLTSDGEKAVNGVVNTLGRIVLFPIGAVLFLLFLAVFVLICVAHPLTIAGGLFPNHAYGSTIGKATSVLECARNQIGKPYIWAAEGPDSFDCSGLVTYCYREALGVEVPHYTKALQKSKKFETVESEEQLSAGDIILDGGDNIHHVGIYTGEGTVVHAPTRGDYVKEVSLDTYKNWVGGYEIYRRYIG